MLKVNFVVHCNSIKENQHLRIVGNLPLLGHWEPISGLPMEEYYEGEWESTQHIEIPHGKISENVGEEFEFKIVKLINNSVPEWEELPGNSNRKFKPKFNTKLILTWSNNIGQALNEGKSSLKLRGFPGVLVRGDNKTGMLKRNPFVGKRNVLSDSDSDEGEGSFSNIIPGKKITDIRESISSVDIEEIYFDTTELELAYQNNKKIQVNFVSSALEKYKEFYSKIEEELKELSELENFQFKWLILGSSGKENVLKRNSSKKISKLNSDQINLEEYEQNSMQTNHFIFLDLESALKAEIGKTSACLYLPANQFEQVVKFLKILENFQLVCFDNGDVNKQLYHLCSGKKTEEENTFFDEQEKDKPRPSKLEMSKIEKVFENMKLERILEELEYCKHEDINLDTIHTFPKSEALDNIVVPNSVLFVDSEVLKVDKTFFDNLINSEREKRLIVIVHKGAIIEPIEFYAQSKNVIVIFDNFTKLNLLGKSYDPSKKHREAIDLIEMRAKLCAADIGGCWTLNDKEFIYNIKEGTESKFDLMRKQLENVILKDFDYFKITMKEKRLKITWNLSHDVRLIKTVARIKSIEEGLIGNFYLVSYHQNFNDIKNNIKLLISTNHHWMINGKNTNILDFGIGHKNNAKNNIEMEEGRESNSSTNSTQSENK